MGKKASQKIAWKLFSQSFLKIGDLWRPNTKKTQARRQQEYDVKYFGNLQTNSQGNILLGQFHSTESPDEIGPRR